MCLDPKTGVFCLHLSCPPLHSGPGGLWEWWGVFPKNSGLTGPHSLVWPKPSWGMSGLPPQAPSSKGQTPTLTQSLLLLEADLCLALIICISSLNPRGKSSETSILAPILLRLGEANPFVRGHRDSKYRVETQTRVWPSQKPMSFPPQLAASAPTSGLHPGPQTYHLQPSFSPGHLQVLAHLWVFALETALLLSLCICAPQQLGNQKGKG